VNLRKYLVLLGVVIFGASGDALLSRGMRQVGEIPLHHWQKLIFAVVHPWVALGVLLLLAFFLRRPPPELDVRPLARLVA